MATTINAATAILNDRVTCIVNTWGVGGGGGRTIISSDVVGTYPCSVQPQASGTRGEGVGEGFDPIYERAMNRVFYQVHFAAPDLPAAGLNPWDTLLWYDDLARGHVLTVLGFWPVGNATGLFYAKAEERT